MIGYEIATGNGSIVCRRVWSRMIVIGYDIAIIAGGQVNEPLLRTCRCVLHEWTSVNIWLYFCYRIIEIILHWNVTFCWRNEMSVSERETRFCRIKESFLFSSFLVEIISDNVSVVQLKQKLAVIWVGLIVFGNCNRLLSIVIEYSLK